MDKLEGLLFRFGIYRCQEGYDCILPKLSPELSHTNGYGNLQ